MKKPLLWIFYGLLGLFLVFVGGGFVLPGEVQVQRSSMIAASPTEIFNVLSDLKRYQDWSPWKPDMVTKVEIKSQVPDKQVITTIDFGLSGKAIATLDLAAVSDTTKVTWLMTIQPNNMLERWLSLGMDQVIGADLEKGLSNLKTHVEAN